MAALSGVPPSDVEMSDDVDSLQASPPDRHQSQESHAAPTTDKQKEALADYTLRRDEIKRSLEAASDKKKHLAAQLTQAEKSKKRLISLLDEATQVAEFLRAKLEAEAEVENGLSLDLAVYENYIAEETKKLRKVNNCSRSYGIPSESDARMITRKMCNSEEDSSSTEIAESSNNCSRSYGIPSKSDTRFEKRNICNSVEDDSLIEIAESSSVQPPQLIAGDLNSVGKLCFAADVVLLCIQNGSEN